jgi:hypothetical protein
MSGNATYQELGTMKSQADQQARIWDGFTSLELRQDSMHHTHGNGALANG